jgi:hypothetical protein
LFGVVHIGDEMRLRGTDLRANIALPGIERANVLVLEDFQGETRIRLALNVRDTILQLL